jgi:signal transduction histidine kinase
MDDALPRPGDVGARNGGGIRVFPAIQWLGSLRPSFRSWLPTFTRTFAIPIAVTALMAGATNWKPRPGLSEAAPLLGRPQVQVFTDRDGLRQNSIEAVGMDEKGYAWIATQDGAMRYDGRVWAAVDMPNPGRSNWVTCMVLATGGTRWFGTNNGGISRWDGRWTCFDESSGLPSASVYSLVEGGGSLWAGTAKGPARWTGTRWEAFPAVRPWAHGPVRALLALGSTQSPEVWVGADGGLGCLKGGEWRWHGQADGLPSAMVTALLEGDGPEGRRGLWVGTQEGLAYGEPGRWKVHGAPADLPHSAVSCLNRTSSREGRPVLWVGTEGGLLRWEGSSRRIWGRAQGLASEVVRSLLVQRDTAGRETVWVGTFGGLVRFREGTWASLDVQGGLPDNLVLSFHENSATGALWFGTFHGLASYHQGRWQEYGPALGLPRIAVFALAGDPDAAVLWVGTRGKGLFRLADGRATPVPGLRDAFVYALHASRDPDGTPVLYAGTRAGLSKWRAGAWTHYDETQNFPTALVSSITETGIPGKAPEIWAGTRGAGLGVLEPGRSTWTWFDAGKGLVDDRVMHLLPVQDDDGRGLWVSTQGGLQRFRVSPPGPTGQIHTKATDPALPGDQVYTARQGPDGSLYAFTHRGVWRLLPGKGSAHAQTFTTGDGLPSNGCVQGASLVDSRGRIWVGTVLGVAILEPSAQFVDDKAKPLYLEAAWNGDRALDPGGPWNLPWRSRHLRVRLSLLSYYREADTHFRSQLIGLEPDPTPWISSSEREFVGLSAGRYLLRFWGRDHAGNVSGPVDIPVKVEAPPWLRWWAMALYILALTGGVIALILWRVDHLQRQNRALAAEVDAATAEVRRQNETLARINHHLGRLNEEKNHMLGIAAHDLRNPLHGIGMMAETLDQDCSAQEAETTGLRILRMCREMTNLIERLLDTSRIDAGQLSLHMEAVDPAILLKEMVERHRLAAEAKGQEVVLDLGEEELPALLADPIHLNEALDNLVSNALKFMPKGPPARRVVLRSRPGLIEVQDEGPGFTEEDKLHAFERFRRLSARPTAGEGSTGLGLSIVKALIEAMGGEIELISEPGRGATFCIRLGRA